MNLKTIPAVVVFASTLFLLQPRMVSAAPISMNAGSRTMVNSATPLSLSFDINAAATDAGITAPLEASRGEVSFFFTDNVDLPVTSTWTERVLRSQLCSTGVLQICSNTMHFVDYRITNSTDPQEFAQVTIGGRSRTTSSPLTGRSEQSSGEVQVFTTSCDFLGVCSTRPVIVDVYSCSSGLVICGWNHYPLYQSDIRRTFVYNGNFSLTLSLDAADLADLSADGVLPFSVTAAVGDFDFLGATLSVDVTGRTGGIPVPLPSSAMLAALGLVALALVRRRHSQDLRGSETAFSSHSCHSGIVRRSLPQAAPRRHAHG